MADSLLAETPSEVGADGARVASRWLQEIERARKQQQEYRDRAKRIIERFRDEKRKGGSKYNILWANTEVLCGAVYQQTPKPDVRRRFADADPVGREASLIIERALAYHADATNLDRTMRSSVFDYALVGRGWARVQYRGTFETRQDRVPIEPGAEIPEDASQQDGLLYTKGEPYEVVTFEEAPASYVPWDGWISDPEPVWANKQWLAIEHRLTRDALRELAPAVADRVALDWSVDGVPDERKGDPMWSRARVWEVWDKENREVLWIATGYKDGPILRQRDPLRLDGFFPGPEPITWSSTNDSDDPIPNFLQYQDQAVMLDLIEERISKLTAELKRRGVVMGDENKDVVDQIARLGDNQFAVIKDPGAFLQNGGIDKLFMELPIDRLAQVILQLRDLREDTKRVIYEITGISDVMRGQTKATETLGAQQLKANFGSQRLHPKIEDVERFARDIMRIQAEIIAEMFQRPTLAAMTNMDPTPAAMGLLQSEKLRGFRVAVETRSTLAADDQQERQDRIELLTSVTGFLTQIAPLVARGAVPLEVAKSLLLFGVRGFRVSREVEESMDQIGAQPALPPGMPPALPSPMPSAPAGPAQFQLIPGGLGT